MSLILHPLLRDLHNVMRWAIVLAALWALFVSYRGWFGGRTWTDRDRRAGLWFSTLTHIQLLVAIGLYLSSPLTHTAWQDLGLAMGDRNQRFFSLEHPIQMLLAIVAATLGYSLSKRAPESGKRFRYAAIAYTLSVLLIVTAVPWPWSSHPRPALPRLQWGENAQ